MEDFYPHRGDADAKVGKADTALALYGWSDDQVDMIDVAHVLGSPLSDGSFGSLRSKSRQSEIGPLSAGWKQLGPIGDAGIVA